MNITLKDGSVKVYDAPMTAADITKDISMGLYRAACCWRTAAAPLTTPHLILWPRRLSACIPR